MLFCSQVSCLAFAEKLNMYVPFVIVKLSLTKKKLMKTLYSGGLVFDGSGNLLENHGVLIDGERISSIAPIG